MSQQLKLRAADGEDIAVLSACMQDAVVACTDLSYLPGERRFVLLAKRFKWENCDDFMMPEADNTPCSSYERTTCVLAFDNVTGVRLFDLKKPEGCDVLELLAIAVEEGGAQGYEGEDGEPDAAEGPRIVLFFAGGGVIRLEVGRVLCHLEDLGEPWTTTRRPCHPVAEAD
jgi:hypothetical protein